ncbi:MAG: trehalose-6-phosphate synthase [Sinimarinibacterium sp.]
MSRLVVVSNRVGSTREAASAGGLAVALVESLRASGGLWFGFSGKTSRSGTRSPQIVNDEGFTRATLNLPLDEHHGYYSGYSNGCLWPICHIRPDLIDFERAHFEAYARVNHRFAQALAPLLRTSDTVWVHDYHLVPLAHELRALGARQRIGFFLHVPFPPPDLLEALPEHQSLLRWLFDYDLVGFQTDSDLHHFHASIERIGGRVRNGQVHAFGHQLRSGAYPIGIDAQQFRALSLSPAGAREFRRMRSSLRGRAQIIGVDRLDYSKGLLRRVHAVEALLDRHPQTRGHVEFLQVAPLSRHELKAYDDFRKELELAAAQVNGRFAQFDWTPVRYLNRPLPRRTLAGLYRASRIGLVTPLRDGMNLVAKEYVAAQDPDDPGVLVLSRFAGAAPQLDAALLVNPYDSGEVADALAMALSMPQAERCSRHARLMAVLLDKDAAAWRADFLGELEGTRNRSAA